MLLVHIGIASLRQFQCAPTTYVNSIIECFHNNLFSQTYQLFSCLSVMNKFLCSLACSLMTTIDSQLYIIDDATLE